LVVEFSPAEFEERSRRVTELLRQRVADSERFARLSPQEQLAELLAQGEPQMPPESAFLVDSVGARMAAQIQKLGVLRWRQQVKALRETSVARRTGSKYGGSDVSTGREEFLSR
jgi:hypothetical protein